MYCSWLEPLPAVLEVFGDDGGGEGDEATEDPDQADGQQDADTRRLRLQRVHNRLHHGAI